MVRQGYNPTSSETERFTVAVGLFKKDEKIYIARLRANGRDHRRALNKPAGVAISKTVKDDSTGARLHERQPTSTV